MENIIIQETKLKGKGVFATRDYKQGDLIENCPVILLSLSDSDKLDETILKNYWFSWNEKDIEEYGAILGGLGMFYNHSQYANASHTPDFDLQTMNIYALRNIKSGVEITLKYCSVWFDIMED